MKRLVTTRWSVPYEAIQAVKTGFQGVTQALNSLTSTPENLQTRGDLQIILLSIENFSFMSHLFYYEDILGQINLIQKKLQKPVIGLDMCVTHLDTTKIFFNRNRDRLGFESVYHSKTKFEEMEIPTEKRIKIKRKLSWEKEEDLYHIYPTPPLEQDMTQGQFFKRSLTGLNSEFSFS